MAETQISAYISEATKDKVERYAEAHGVKKGHLVEEGLLHHLQALRELPADIVIPPRIIVTADSFEKVASICVHAFAKPPTRSHKFQAVLNLRAPSTDRRRCYWAGQPMRFVSSTTSS